ncbi:MAG: Trp family transcriptional regulator [bacterium]|nr:Trp family transcriptional regulator [bacterium]
MTQVSKHPISSKIYERILEIFFKSLSEVKMTDESRQFIKDFLTPTEQIMLAKRLAIAFLLEKDYDFRAIAKILRVSLGTVARVNLMKKFGNQGYQKIIGKLLKEENINDFLLKAGEVLTGMAGQGGKGSDAWRYLHQEIKIKLREKPF